MLEFNRDRILSAIDTLDKALGAKNIERPCYLIIVGAASLILKFNLKRATADIDVMEPISQSPGIHGGLGALLSRMGFHIVSEVMVNLHPDYTDRLVFYAEKGMIRVFTLDAIDLVISKIARGFDKDLDDILESDVLTDMDMAALQSAYFEATAYWIGDENRYKTNWDRFYELFNEKKSE